MECLSHKKGTTATINSCRRQRLKRQQTCKINKQGRRAQCAMIEKKKTKKLNSKNLRKPAECVYTVHGRSHLFSFSFLFSYSYSGRIRCHLYFSHYIAMLWRWCAPISLSLHSFSDNSVFLVCVRRIFFPLLSCLDQWIPFSYFLFCLFTLSCK